MIRKWLNELTNEQLNNVLTTKMNGGSYTYMSDEYGCTGPCLVGVVVGGFGMPHSHPSSHYKVSIEHRYDRACCELGLAKTNALVRERALQILASRVAVEKHEPAYCTN